MPASQQAGRFPGEPGRVVRCPVRLRGAAELGRRHRPCGGARVATEAQGPGRDLLEACQELASRRTGLARRSRCYPAGRWSRRRFLKGWGEGRGCASVRKELEGREEAAARGDGAPFTAQKGALPRDLRHSSPPALLARAGSAQSLTGQLRRTDPPRTGLLPFSVENCFTARWVPLSRNPLDSQAIRDAPLLRLTYKLPVVSSGFLPGNLNLCLMFIAQSLESLFFSHLPPLSQIQWAHFWGKNSMYNIHILDAYMLFRLFPNCNAVSSCWCAVRIAPLSPQLAALYWTYRSACT